MLYLLFLLQTRQQWDPCQCHLRWLSTDPQCPHAVTTHHSKPVPQHPEVREGAATALDCYLEMNNIKLRETALMFCKKMKEEKNSNYFNWALHLSLPAAPTPRPRPRTDQCFGRAGNRGNSHWEDEVSSRSESPPFGSRMGADTRYKQISCFIKLVQVQLEKSKMFGQFSEVEFGSKSLRPQTNTPETDVKSVARTWNKLWMWC